MEHVGRVKCRTCGETFSSRKELEMHNKEVHGIPPEEERELREGADKKTQTHG